MLHTCYLCVSNEDVAYFKLTRSIHRTLENHVGIRLSAYLLSADRLDLYLRVLTQTVLVSASAVS